MGDVIALILFILVSFLAWKLKDIMKEWMPVTLLGLLLICFVMNSTVLLPSSSLLVVLEYSYILNPLSVIVVGAIGASLGELTGYMIGAEGASIIKRFKKLSKITNFKKHSFLWVMLFAFIPFPVFDIAGIMAGRIRMNSIKFLLASFIGKAVKMTFYVMLIHLVSSFGG